MIYPSAPLETTSIVKRVWKKTNGNEGFNNSITVPIKKLLN